MVKTEMAEEDRHAMLLKKQIEAGKAAGGFQDFLLLVHTYQGQLSKIWVLEIWEFGNLETWKSRNVGSNKSKKNSKLKIRSAQNAGKVWISRKKILLAPFGAI